MSERSDTRIFRVHQRIDRIATIATARCLPIACVAVLQTLNWFSDPTGGGMRASVSTIAERMGASRRTVVDAIRRLVTADLLVPLEPPRVKKAPVLYAFGPDISPEHPMNQAGHARKKAALREAYARVRKAVRRRAREAYRDQLDGQNLQSQ